MKRDMQYYSFIRHHVPWYLSIEVNIILIGRLSLLHEYFWVPIASLSRVTYPSICMKLYKSCFRKNRNAYWLMLMNAQCLNIPNISKTNKYLRKRMHFSTELFQFCHFFQFLAILEKIRLLALSCFLGVINFYTIPLFIEMYGKITRIVKGIAQQISYLFSKRP